MPGRLHQHPTDVTIPCLGDRAAILPAATRVLAGHQTNVGHQLARRFEPPKIVDLGHDRHRRNHRDAAKAHELGDAVAITIVVNELRQPAFQFTNSVIMLR